MFSVIEILKKGRAAKESWCNDRCDKIEKHLQVTGIKKVSRSLLKRKKNSSPEASLKIKKET